MKITPLSIPDVVLIEPTVFHDERGFLFESFHRQRFEQATGCVLDFVQENHSRSTRNVLRGLHYQAGRPQGKLVRALAGEIFDVAVDLRRNSPTFGRWVGCVLSADNGRQLWIPEGFAHGVLVLSDQADLLYKLTDYWAPECERCIAWNDPDLAIDWPLQGPPLLSEKDRLGRAFRDAEMFD